MPLQVCSSAYWEGCLLTREITDHEERLFLFTKAVEWDPELPYAPLLRFVSLIFR